MAISSVGGTSTAFAAQASSSADGEDQKAGTTDSAVEPAAAESSPSAVVSLGNTLPADIQLYTGKLSMIPMSSLTAPQIFVKTDQDGDGKINFKEFSEQLKRTGTSEAAAKVLFDSFKKSKGGTISLDDFVDGVVAANKNGSSVFQDLYSSYVSGSDGKFDIATSDAFMASGGSVVTDYFTRHPEMQRRG